MLFKLKNLISKSFADISDSIPHAIICLRSVRDNNKQIVNFEWLSLNKYAEDFFGDVSKNLVGKLFFSLPPDLEASEMLHDYASVVSCGKPFCNEFLHKQKSIDCWFKATVMKCDDGLVITYEDVSEKKALKESLKQKKEEGELIAGLKAQAHELKVILETIPQIAWTASSQGIVTYFNQRYFEFTGNTFEQAANWEWKSVIHPAMLDQYLLAMKHSIDTGEDFCIEALFKRKGGHTYRWHLSRATAIRDEFNKITSWVGTATDINEQKKIEENLRATQGLETAIRLKAEAQSEWLNNMVMQAPFIVCILRGADHVHELINPSYQQLFGDRQLTGRKVVDALPALEGQLFLNILNKVYSTGETVSRKEVRLLIARGHDANIEEIFINVTCQPLYSDEKEIDGILVFAYDVTEQVLARKILEKNAEDLNIILEVIPQIAWVAKPNGKMNYYNKKWYSYTGLTIGQTEKEGWRSVIHPDLYERYIFDWSHSVKWGENFNTETLIKRGSDQAYRWHLSQAIPVKNKLGEITQWVGTLTDINDDKNLKNELENLVLERTREVMHSNEELKLSNIKLEEFAFVASHDLREPLRKIITNGDFLRIDFIDQLGESGRQYISRIQNSALRMQKLIEDLLSFSQLSYNKTSIEKVHLGELVKGVVEEQLIMIKDNMPQITIKKLPAIECIPAMMEQLFSNLISNGLKFTAPGVTPKIVISCKNISGIYTGIANALPKEKYCNIYVRDNGIGFNNQYVEQIFIIFKRLNSQSKYQGTGIGLALCKKIVEDHKGFITAKSKLNKGATFIITLPYLQKI